MSELERSAAQQSAAPAVVRTGRTPNGPIPRVTAVAVDAASAAPAYANFFRVTHTPDEIVLDLGFDNGLRPVGRITGNSREIFLTSWLRSGPW